jgi:hypothetical protein
VKEMVTLWITRLCKYILQSLWELSKPCEEERKLSEKDTLENDDTITKLPKPLLILKLKKGAKR